MKFGYARVSSNTQDHAAQIEALKAAGCARIFSEKASGKSTNGRPEFARLMKVLRQGASACEAPTDAGRLVMTIMGVIAEFERSLIRERCEEGTQWAKRQATK